MMAEAFIYWGVGWDEAGFYIAAFLHYPQGEKRDFRVDVRFRDPELALAAMEGLAESWEALARAMGLRVNNRILDDEGSWWN